MSYWRRIFFSFLFFFPFSLFAQDAHTHLRRRNSERYRFRFPAHRPCSSSSTAALRCYIRSLTARPETLSAAWRNRIPSAQ